MSDLGVSTRRGTCAATLPAGPPQGQAERRRPLVEEPRRRRADWGRATRSETDKLADLLVVDGEPVADITVLQHHDNLLLILKGAASVKDAFRRPG